MKEVKFVLEKTPVKVLSSAYRALLGSCIHIFRNSVDHGLETPADREKVGKPRKGQVKVFFGPAEGHTIQIHIEDDGRGINPTIISKRAVDKELCTPDQVAALDRTGILELIFLPGFSTRDEISDLSGRGVGLDAVKIEVEKLGGKISITSEVGRGSRFTLDVPILKKKLTNH